MHQHKPRFLPIPGRGFRSASSGEVSEWNEQAIISRALVKAQADRLPDSGLDKGYERA
jgi:hypothetical protein